MCVTTVGVGSSRGIRVGEEGGVKATPRAGTPCRTGCGPPAKSEVLPVHCGCLEGCLTLVTVFGPRGASSRSADASAPSSLMHSASLVRMASVPPATRRAATHTLWRGFMFSRRHRRRRERWRFRRLPHSDREEALLIAASRRARVILSEPTSLHCVSTRRRAAAIHCAPFDSPQPLPIDTGSRPTL